MSRTDHLPELDILHSQVADLSRRLAERDRSMQDLREHSAMLRAIIEGTATETGDEFFAALVRHLTAVLHIQYAVIGEVQGDHIKKIRTLAVSAGGVLVDNFDYELADTPCAAALTQTFACFNRDVQATFPQFQRLVDLGAESYCAVPIRTKGGAAIGLLVVMDTKPLEHSDALQSLLGVFAPRVAAEFERKRAEQERAQALADLHNVIETIPDIVFALDTQGNVVKWNQRLGDVTGYSPEELLNMPALAFVPPEERVRTATAIERAFTEGYAELEGHLLTKEHRLIPYHWTGALLKNLHGESIGITGIGRDVSGKKQAEAELRASEERYRALYEETPTMYFTLATDGTVLSVNRFGAEQLGYRVEELIGHSVLDLFHVRDKEAVVSSLSECLANPEEMRHWAFRKVRKDGSIVWVREAVRVGQSSSGESVLLVTCEDITEHKQFAEREASRVRQLKKLYELSMTLSGVPGVVLEHVVRAIGELFNVQVVCLSEIIGQELYFKSVYVNGQTFMDAGHCSLAITPCATVEQTKDLRIFDRVIERFPQASFLRDHQAVSYCGFPALDNEGCVVAVTCLLDDKPHDYSKEEQDLLRIFGQRIATEIERNHHAVEQQRAADELRRSHDFIRQIIDADPNFIFVKNRAGQFTLVNKAVANAYGTTVEQLLGKTDADFNANPDEVEFFRQKDLEVMDSLQERFIPEEVITDSTGKMRWLQTVKRPILDEQGRAIMVLGAATDITDRKRMEEVLRQRERDLRIAIEERERISQDLHDGILQSLFAVGLGLETVKSMMSPRARQAAGRPLDHAIQQLNLVMREIRNFIAGLGSDLLQGKDLTTALQSMLKSLTENQTTRVRLAVENRAAKAISVEQSLHLFHVIQEAVSNCIRHGRAQEAMVSLKMLKQGIRLSIRDNGRGFNEGAVKGIGHGLANMEARAMKIGGRFALLSKENEGTRIILDLPKEVPGASR